MSKLEELASRVSKVMEDLGMAGSGTASAKMEAEKIAASLAATGLEAKASQVGGIKDQLDQALSDLKASRAKLDETLKRINGLKGS